MLFRIRAGLGQEIGQQAEAFPAIIIVGVDDGEGLLHRIAAAEDRVAGAPGFGAPFGHGEALWQSVQLLIDIRHRNLPGNAVANMFLKGFLDFLLDDEHHPAKPGGDGVVNGIIDDQLPAGTDGRNLLESTEPAAHTGGHDNQRGFLRGIHRVSPFSGGENG